MPKTMNFSRNRIKMPILEKFAQIKTITITKKMVFKLPNDTIELLPLVHNPNWILLNWLTTMWRCGLH